MNKRFILTCILTYILLTSCNQPNYDKKYFVGEIFLIADTIKTKNLVGKEIEIEGVYNGQINIYDSLLFYYPYQSTKHFYEIYNLKNDSLLGNFCLRGGGPNETVGIAFICNFYMDKGSLKTLLYAANEKKLIVWNISKSLKNQTTVNDTIIAYDWMVDNHIAIYNRIYHLDDSTIFVEMQPRSTTLDRKSASLPVYEKRTIYTNQNIQTYPVFINTPKSDGTEFISPEQFLSTYSCTKPDSKKIVQSVRHLQQINIIDLETGDVKGFRIKGTPDFSIFEKEITNVKKNYTNIEANDKYIYALYRGTKMNESGNDIQSQLHVYDWDGNLRHKYNLGEVINHITLDPVNTILYGRNVETEKIYRYDLND